MNSRTLYSLKLTILIIVLSIDLKIYSQTKDKRISDTVENTDSSDNNYKRKYLYLGINMKEENNMVSIGIAPTTLFYRRGDNNIDKYFGLNLILRYDKKFIPAISVYTDIIGDYYQVAGTYGEIKYFALALNLGVRYFYSQNRNIKLNIASSNLNGPYIDFKLNNLLTYKAVSTEHSEFTPSIPGAFIFSLGYQQKFTKFLLMDGNIFFGMNTKEGSYTYFDNNLSGQSSLFLIGVSFKMGFGLGWK